MVQRLQHRRLERHIEFWLIEPPAFTLCRVPLPSIP